MCPGAVWAASVLAGGQHPVTVVSSVAVGGGGSGAGSAARIEIVEVENSAPSILEFQGHARPEGQKPT